MSRSDIRTFAPDPRRDIAMGPSAKGGTGAQDTSEVAAEIMALKSEVVRLEHALVERGNRALAEREAEHESIARELHDKFGQYLTVMALELAAIGADGATPPPLRDRLQTLRSLTSEAQQEMATLAWLIRPASLQGLDLENACRRLAAEWGDRSSLSFDLHLSLGARALTPIIETTLYRVLQEALTNVAKHADATRVGIILRASSHEVVLVVEDDGRGFIWEQDGLPSTALGLRGIRERLALVSGRLEIETSPARGATLLVSVPL
jgi:chemotaxis family two-component system sensor kinase Cph1